MAYIPDPEKLKEAAIKWRQWKPRETMKIKIYGKMINMRVTEEGKVYIEILGDIPFGVISQEEKMIILRPFEEDYAGVLTIDIEGERNERPFKYSQEWLDQNQQEMGDPYKEKRCPHCKYGIAVIDSLFDKNDKEYKHYICYRCNKRWKVKREWVVK